MFKLLGQMVGEEGFDAKRTVDGTLLIKSGPTVFYSEFGSGQCGACPRVDMRIFAVDKQLQLHEALNLGGVIDNAGGASEDFSISPNWSRVTLFKQADMDEKAEPGGWSSTDWCLQGLEYKECGKKENVEPPDPPVLKELRNPE